MWFYKIWCTEGSILGHFFFLVYINDIVSDIQSSIRLFADNTTLYVIVDDPKSAGHVLYSDLSISISGQNNGSLLLIQLKPSFYSLLTKKHRNRHPNLYFNGNQIQEVSTHKHLELNFSNNGHWVQHIDDIVKKASSRLQILREHKYELNRRSLETLFFSYIRPILEYADVICDNTRAELAQEV